MRPGPAKSPGQMVKHQRWGTLTGPCWVLSMTGRGENGAWVLRTWDRDGGVSQWLRKGVRSWDKRQD